MSVVYVGYSLSCVVVQGRKFGKKDLGKKFEMKNEDDLCLEYPRGFAKCDKDGKIIDPMAAQMAKQNYNAAEAEKAAKEKQAKAAEAAKKEKERKEKAWIANRKKQDDAKKEAEKKGK